MQSSALPNVEYWTSMQGERYRSIQVRRARGGHAHYAMQMGWLRRYLGDRASALGRPVRLLDFGCGFGRVAYLSAELGVVDYYGFDFSERMSAPLQAAPPAAYAADIGSRVRVGSDVGYAFAGEKFDVILTISVLIHNDEASARSILETLTGLVGDQGEVVLMENVLVGATFLDNYWHGGCWRHDFCGYAADRLAIEIDCDTLPEQAIYRLSRLSSRRPAFSIRRAGRQISTNRLDEAREAAVDVRAAGDPLRDLPVSSLVGRYLDLQEAADVQTGRFDRLLRLARCVRQHRNKLQAELRTVQSRCRELEASLARTQQELARHSAIERQMALGDEISKALLCTGSDAPALMVPASMSSDPGEAEASWVVDAERDRRYAQPDHPAFDSVLTLCTQEWVGVRAASASFPGHKLAVSKNAQWTTQAVRQVLHELDRLSTRTLVVQGFSSGLANLLVALRVARPELKICAVWHGTMAAWCFDEERDLARRFLELTERNVLDRVHFLRRGLHALHPKCFAPLLPNLPPVVTPHRLAPAWSTKPGTCLFASWNNVWKNMYANLAGAASSRSVERIFSYGAVEGLSVWASRLKVVEFGSRERHFSFLGSVDLVLNATINDCIPMVELEALAVGTPTLASPLDLDFGTGHPLRRLCTVDSPHNVAEIAARINAIADCPADELGQMIEDYRGLVTRTSFERYGQFIHG